MKYLWLQPRHPEGDPIGRPIRWPRVPGQGQVIDTDTGTRMTVLEVGPGETRQIQPGSSGRTFTTQVYPVAVQPVAPPVKPRGKYKPKPKPKPLKPTPPGKPVPVIHVEVGRRFRSMHEAAREVLGDATLATVVCRAARKGYRVKGQTFRHANPADAPPPKPLPRRQGRRKPIVVLIGSKVRWYESARSAAAALFPDRDAQAVGGRISEARIAGRHYQGLRFRLATKAETAAARLSG